MVIFYGSQTGTAEDFSARLMKDLRRMGIGCTVQDPEDHNMVSEDLQEILVCFKLDRQFIKGKCISLILLCAMVLMQVYLSLTRCSVCCVSVLCQCVVLSVLCGNA